MRPRGSAATWFCAPLGAAIHGAVLVALALAALWSPIEDMSPSVRPLLLQLAPPPPQPTSRSSSTLAESLPVVITRARFVPQIHDAVLTPSFSSVGVPDGFLVGPATDSAGGVPGGVAGGVPGGLVGGAIGGLGTELPRFPQPDVGPSPIRMPQPSYTREAIRDNVTGVVVLRVVIDERGKVEVLKVLRSIPELDEEAIRVVETRWQFEPARKHGRPIPTLSDLVVRFNLH